MDNQYYIEKIKTVFETELNKYPKFSLRQFVVMNKEIILEICRTGKLNEGIELLSAFVLKLPANCDLQKNLIKIIKEYLNEQDK